MNRKNIREAAVWVGLAAVIVAALQTAYFIREFRADSHASELAGVRMLATPSYGEDGQKARTAQVQATTKMNESAKMMMLTMFADIIGLIVIGTFERARIRERLTEQAHVPSQKIFSRLMMASACLFACIAPWVARHTLPF
jgi:hypothetical protein